MDNHKSREKLKYQAEFYKGEYLKGNIKIEFAKEMIVPYVNLLLADREKLSKAYNRYLPNITFEKFIKGY